jgi:integrase
MHIKLTPAFVRDVPLPPSGRITYWDTAMPSFGLMVTEKGTRSFVYLYRNVRHVKRKKTWAARIDGKSAGLTLDQAHREAKKLAGDVERGDDPVEQERAERRKAKEERQRAEAATTTTLKATCEKYLTIEAGMMRDANGKVTFSGKLRSAEQRCKVFERSIYPEKISGRQFEEIKRSEITELLDKIEEERGPRAAHVAGAYLSRVCSWYAARNDDYRSPFVRGTATRVNPKQRAGRRVLSDEEIRDVWAATEPAALADDIPLCFARLLRTLLVSAVRRTEAARMSWPEIRLIQRDDFDGVVSTVPAARMKGKQDHAVPVTPALTAIIGERPKDAKSRPYVFSTDGGNTPFSGYSKAKAALDREIGKRRKAEGRDPMPPWTLSRDVRRTAKTLMARAGVRPNVSERVLAHVIPGVEGVYDCYEYLPPKLDALERLAALVDRIVNPADNVRPQLKREA